MQSLSRRRLLRTSALAASAGLAGCLDGFGVGGGDVDAIELQRAAGPGPDAVPLAVANQPIVLDFFATWCAPCIPQMDAIWAATRERPDAHYVSVTNESDANAVGQWWDEYGGEWPAVMDPEATATSRYEAPRLPTTLVLPPGGGPGSEVWRHVGVARSERVVEAIDEAASTGDVAPDGDRAGGGAE